MKEDEVIVKLIGREMTGLIKVAVCIGRSRNGVIRESKEVRESR